MLLFSLNLAVPVAKKLFDVDLYEQAPGSKALIEKLKLMPETLQIEQDQKAAAPAFNAYLTRAFSAQK
jgi:glutathione S-transferase